MVRGQFDIAAVWVRKVMGKKATKVSQFVSKKLCKPHNKALPHDWLILVAINLS